MKHSAAIHDRPSSALLLAGLLTGPFFSMLSIGIVNVALPSLAVLFGEDVDTVQWVSLGYLMTIPLLIPLMGIAGGRFGHDTVHNIGLMLFAAASLMIVFSPGLAWMTVFRILQGVGASMFQANNMTLISLAFPPDKRGRVLGMLSGSVGLGSLLGPSVGGVLIDWFSWQAMFFLQVPFLALAAGIAQRYIRVGRPGQAAKVDVFGAILFSALVGVVMLIASFIRQWGWGTAGMILLYAGAAALLAINWSWSRRREKPYLDPRLLTISALRTGLLVSLLSFAAALAVQVSASFHLQTLLGLNPTTAGLLMSAYPLLLAVSGPVCGSLSDRYGSEKVIIAGLATMGTASFLMLAVGSGSGAAIATALLGLLGFGMGMVTSPNYRMVMNHAPADLTGTVGSMAALGRTIGMAVGTTAGFLLMNIWIPSEWGDVTGILTNGTREMERLALTGFNTTYMVMGLICMLLSLSVWLSVKDRGR